MHCIRCGIHMVGGVPGCDRLDLGRSRRHRRVATAAHIAAPNAACTARTTSAPAPRSPSSRVMSVLSAVAAVARRARATPATQGRFWTTARRVESVFGRDAIALALETSTRADHWELANAAATASRTVALLVRPIDENR